MAAEVSLADFTLPALIQPELRGREVASVIQELCGLLHRQGRVPELLPFYHAILNREFLSGTALECGLAIPHARPARVERLSFALGRSPEPILWGPRGGASVTLVFLVAIPASDSGGYLSLVGAMARLGRSEALLEALRQGPDAEAMGAVLEQVRLRLSPTRSQAASASAES